MRNVAEGGVVMLLAVTARRSILSRASPSFSGASGAVTMRVRFNADLSV